MIKYRFCHIIPADSATHIRGIVELIYKERLEEQHCFVVASEKIYSEFNAHDNFYYEKNLVSDVKVIKKYLMNSDFVIVHSMYLSVRQLFRIPKSQLKKIVWVIWGHDLYVVGNPSTPIDVIKYLYRKMNFFLKIYRLKRIHGIGFGFKYDSLRIYKLFGDKIKMFRLPYFQPMFSENYATDCSNTTRIMLGHSAYPFINHMEILERLKKYSNENICVSLVLSYGHESYREKVISRAISIFGKDKVEIIKNAMPYNAYIEYLKTIDIAIFDFKHQSALGNFYILNYFGKKIYLNENGVLFKSYTMEGIQNYKTSTIGNVEFSEFVRPVDETSRNNMRRFAESCIDKESIRSSWLLTFRELTNECEQ